MLRIFVVSIRHNILKHNKMELSNERVQEIKDYFYNEIVEVNSEKQADEKIIETFGTLKVIVEKGRDYNSVIWEVYPPKGVAKEPLFIHIKK